MYIAHTVPGRYTLKPLSLVLYLEEEEEEEEEEGICKLVKLEKYLSAAM